MYEEPKIDMVEWERQNDGQVSPRTEEFLKRYGDEVSKIRADVIKAADTLEETIAMRNNHIAKASKDDEIDVGESVAANKSVTIDVDDAKWHKDYVAKMENNLERFKKLGLYDQLKDLKIIRELEVVDDEDDESDDGLEWSELTYCTSSGSGNVDSRNGTSDGKDE